MNSRSMKFDPEQWLRDDIEAEWTLTTEQNRRRAPRASDGSEAAAVAAATEQTGIHAIINSSLVSYERLPMLDVIFDRLVRLMTTSLRNFTSDNIEVSIDNIASVRFGDVLGEMRSPSMIGVFRAKEWDNFGLLIAGSDLTFAIVDVLLGGRRETAPMRTEGRAFTTIETTLVERMIDVVVKDLSAAFEPLSPVAFQLERIETNPRFASVARPTNAAVNVRFRIEMDERGGMLDLVIPYATLEPIRELLLQRFMGEKFGRDSIWENHLATELYRTHVEVEAVLGEQRMTLADVMTFRPGQTILFGTHAKQPIELRCGGRALAHGRMGRSGKRMAIQLTDSKPVQAPAAPFRTRDEE